ncbi:unnamed protein product [Cyprideis torosa]|uniref:C-type lectin domain-containing protein n=1 Tax=Cyprideis torosa TaxID=163714 RepID=A0A7R8WEH3_9CRUS|nr:unnamed protein product [Cyprideis torosa]CAG0889807.1 unnamed protein product [Cyprideis torosa]
MKAAHFGKMDVQVPCGMLGSCMRNTLIRNVVAFEEVANEVLPDCYLKPVGELINPGGTAESGFNSEKATWQEAIHRCVRMNGLLFTSDDREDVNALQRELWRREAQGEYWIGAFYNWKQGSWVWGTNGHRGGKSVGANPSQKEDMRDNRRDGRFTRTAEPSRSPMTSATWGYGESPLLCSLVLCSAALVLL